MKYNIHSLAFTPLQDNANYNKNRGICSNTKYIYVLGGEDPYKVADKDEEIYNIAGY